MSHWNYRLMERVSNPGTALEDKDLVLTEVYYDENGVPDGYIDAAHFCGETQEEIFQALARAFDAYNSPVLTPKDFKSFDMDVDANEATVSEYATVSEVEALKG
jgi:hypothetical protein